MTPTDAGTMMPLTSGEESISSLQRTRRPRFRSGRSLCSLGSPLNARPLGGGVAVRVQVAIAILLIGCARVQVFAQRDDCDLAAVIAGRNATDLSFPIRIRRGFLKEKPQIAVPESAESALRAALLANVPCQVLSERFRDRSSAADADGLVVIYQWLSAGRRPRALLGYHWAPFEFREAVPGDELWIPEPYFYDVVEVQQGPGAVLRSIWQDEEVDSVRLRRLGAVPVSFQPFPRPADGLILFASFRTFGYARDDGGRGLGYGFGTFFPVRSDTGAIALVRGCFDGDDERLQAPLGQPSAEWQGHDLNVFLDHTSGLPVITDATLRPHGWFSVSVWRTSLGKFERVYRDRQLKIFTSETAWTTDPARDVSVIQVVTQNLLAKPLEYQYSILRDQEDEIEFELADLPTPLEVLRK
jgi:hypothetical protein